MRASRILALARTMRCASVGAALRNACAISSVVRPQTSRNVSATCASGRKRRMAAGEDEPQPIVLDGLAVPWSGLVDDGIHLLGDILHRVEPRASAYAIDGLEATGRYQPRARIRRHAVARPLLERRAEGVVQRLLGEVEVAEQPDQRGEDAARFGAIDGLGRGAHTLERIHARR